MKTPITIILALFILATHVAASEWVSLFDGKSLKGWQKRGGDATYTVEDGAIVGHNGPGHNTFLCTKKKYGDFELEFDVFLKDKMNSGVQIRSKEKWDKWREQKVKKVYGPQIEIELGPGEAGYLYGEAAGGWMTPKEDLIRHDVFKNGEWNHYRIVARGPRIQTFLNGKQISDLVHEEIYENHKSGFIGLQVHSINAPEKTLKVKWKNIRIRETDTKGWTSMFNGKNLNGWTPKVQGFEAGENPGDIFRVENGVLKVSYDQFDEFGKRFGHLFYKSPYSYYKFRMEYRFVGEQAKGGPNWAYRNSGVMIHGQTVESMKKTQDFPTSIEVQLLGADEGKVRTTGNLCTPGTIFWKDGVVNKKHCIESNSDSYAGDQWVQIEIHAYGDKEIVHFINGQEVLRYQDPQLDDGTPLGAGTLSLQAESHGCEFRNIEIKKLD
ncbi:MAG: DUF1080 domain-containing protein [Puniceicoccaceae bacterium]